MSVIHYTPAGLISQFLSQVVDVFYWRDSAVLLSVLCGVRL